MTRRRDLVGAIAFAAIPFSSLAASDALAEAIAAATGGREPAEGGIVLSGPAVAENGNQVPVTVAVESPQTPALWVRAIHLFATRNPTPGIVTFRLSPAVPRAEVTTRIRLAEDQMVIAIAELSDGTLRRAVASIRVSTGGCV